MKSKKFFFTIDVDWVRGSELGLRHLMELCEQKQLKATLFVAGKFVEEYPEIIKNIFAKGYEIGTHGWEHGTDDQENFLTTSYEAQKRWVQLSTEALEKVTGRRPTAFRAPKLKISELTFKVLSEENYRLDSSVPARRFDFGFGQINSPRYFMAPLEPYFPARNNLGVKGSCSILEVPPSAFIIPVNMKALKKFGLTLLKLLVWKISQVSSILIFYCHPYDFVSPEHFTQHGYAPGRYSGRPDDLGILEQFVDFIKTLNYQTEFISQVE